MTTSIYLLNPYKIAALQYKYHVSSSRAKSNDDYIHGANLATLRRGARWIDSNEKSRAPPSSTNETLSLFLSVYTSTEIRFTQQNVLLSYSVLKSASSYWPADSQMSFYTSKHASVFNPHY